MVCAELIQRIAAVFSTRQFDQQTHAVDNQELLAV
jgi:hypothetical protein